MNQAEESELIAKALQGDGEAFSDLVKPYLGLFTAGIHRILQSLKLPSPLRRPVCPGLLVLSRRIGGHGTLSAATRSAARSAM